MIPVHVDLVKNSRNVVELYKINNKDRTAVITAIATAITIFFLDLIISLKSNPDVWIALKLSGLDTNPLLLPIFKNLSFRWLSCLLYTSDAADDP